MGGAKCTPKILNITSLAKRFLEALSKYPCTRRQHNTYAIKIVAIVKTQLYEIAENTSTKLPSQQKCDTEMMNLKQHKLNAVYHIIADKSQH